MRANCGDKAYRDCMIFILITMTALSVSGMRYAQGPLITRCLASYDNKRSGVGFIFQLLAYFLNETSLSLRLFLP